MIKIFQELNYWKDYFRVYASDFENPCKAVIYYFLHVCSADLGMTLRRAEGERKLTYSKVLPGTAVIIHFYEGIEFSTTDTLL